MYPSDTLPQPIKVVYYTHPLCKASWEMQENWRRFIETYGKYLNFQFCISKDAARIATAVDQALSTYPACLAVKAAGLQSSYAADLYLDRLRSAAIAEASDISNVVVLVDIAREVNKAYRGYFDFQRFGKDFDAKPARVALQADYQKIYCNRIETYPTITMTTRGKGLKLTGFSSYQQLAQSIHKLLHIPTDTKPITNSSKTNEIEDVAL